jgi:4-hydroxybenzoate polyprenyltransferase
MYTYLLSGAGMVWNDWIDRDIDAQVARTKNRPLASGRLSTRTALIWMLVQYAASVWLMDSMLSGQNVYVHPHHNQINHPLS